MTKRPVARYACAAMNPVDTAIAIALGHLAQNTPLGEDLTLRAFRSVMAGRATPAQLGALLLALRARGETVDELVGAVRALREEMRPVDLGDADRLVDTCGTGGGSVRTLNISTAAALVAAGAGVRIAKHGNRSFTSRSGSADVLEALGVAVDVALGAASHLIEEAGVVFLFAPTHHPAMRHAAPVRRELAVPTVMNLIGPLANPAGVARQVVGVAESRHGPLMAGAMQRLGTVHGMVVHAGLGLDEIAPLGETTVWEVRPGGVTEWQLDPTTYGLATANLQGIEGGEPAENAAAIERLFAEPEMVPEALRAAVLLNAAAAITVAGKVTDMQSGVVAATRSLHSGAALDRLQRLRRLMPLRTS